MLVSFLVVFNIVTHQFVALSSNLYFSIQLYLLAAIMVMLAYLIMQPHFGAIPSSSQTKTSHQKKKPVSKASKPQKPQKQTETVKEKPKKQKAKSKEKPSEDSSELKQWKKLYRVAKE